MSNITKIVLGTGIGAALIGGVSYLFRLKRTVVDMEINPTVKVHKINLQGLMLRIDVQLKNPNKTALNIKFPFVKLMYKDVVLGSSQVLNKDIDIPAYGETNIEKIMLNIPIISLLNFASGLWNSLKKKELVKIDVQTITTVDLGWKKMPFNKTQEVTLNA